MKLLEREAQVALLEDSYRRVKDGTAGVAVLLFGEAGIGKTAVVQAFIESPCIAGEVMLTGCEELVTPRPLGPIADIADRFPPSVAAALGEGRTYSGLFPALISSLKMASMP